MGKIYDTAYKGSVATVYDDGKEVRRFYFRLAVFLKDEKNVFIPTCLFDTKDDWNNLALALMNAMIDRTSGGYWMAQLEQYNDASTEKCATVENANASDDEKNTLRVMVMLMRQDRRNDGIADSFITNYLNHVPAAELTEKELEPMFNQCYLTII